MWRSPKTPNAARASRKRAPKSRAGRHREMGGDKRREKRRRGDEGVGEQAHPKDEEAGSQVERMAEVAIGTPGHQDDLLVAVNRSERPEAEGQSSRDPDRG